MCFVSCTVQTSERRLYRNAVEYAQQSFSGRMQIPGQGIAFVQEMDQRHAGVERELRDGLVQADQVYNNTMALILENSAKAGAACAGLGAVFFGIALASGPAGWLAGSIFGAVFGGGTGVLTGGILTVADAINGYFQSLKNLFQLEVNFVNQNYAILSQRIANHPEEHHQLLPLKTHFDWVLGRVAAIARECSEIESREMQAQLQRSRETSDFNNTQRMNRNAYIASHPNNSGAAYFAAQTRYPDRHSF